MTSVASGPRAMAHEQKEGERVVLELHGTGALFGPKPGRGLNTSTLRVCRWNGVVPSPMAK